MKIEIKFQKPMSKLNSSKFIRQILTFLIEEANGKSSIITFLED